MASRHELGMQSRHGETEIFANRVNIVEVESRVSRIRVLFQHVRRPLQRKVLIIGCQMRTVAELWTVSLKGAFADQVNRAGHRVGSRRWQRRLDDLYSSYVAD